MRRTPIAHVVFPRPSLLRPVSEFAWDAIRALQDARRLDVEVLMPVPHPSARKLQGVSRALRGASTWPEAIDDALLRLDPKPTLVHYVPLPFRSIESATASIAAKLVARRRAARPAVIEGSFLDEGGYAAALAARAIGARSIAVAHGSDVRMARSRRDGGRARRALQAIEDSSAIVAVSQELASEIALLGRSAEIIRFTADPGRFHAAEQPAGSPLVLFVGRISKAKGVDVLIEAMALLDRKDARLRLIGPETDELDAMAEARKLGLEDRVELAGELMRDDLPHHYEQASLLALPSRSEGLPCVLVEALLSGRPAVATDVGGIRELIGDHNGRLVPVSDAAALAKAIDQIIAERDKGTWRAESLRASAEPFAWGAMRPKLEALTFKLIEAH